MRQKRNFSHPISRSIGPDTCKVFGGFLCLHLLFSFLLVFSLNERITQPPVWVVVGAEPGLSSHPPLHFSFGCCYFSPSPNFPSRSNVSATCCCCHPRPLRCSKWPDVHTPKPLPRPKPPPWCEHCRTCYWAVRRRRCLFNGPPVRCSHAVAFRSPMCCISMCLWGHLLDIWCFWSCPVPPPTTTLQHCVCLGCSFCCIKLLCSFSLSFFLFPFYFSLPRCVATDAGASANGESALCVRVCGSRGGL